MSNGKLVDEKFTNTEPTDHAVNSGAPLNARGKPETAAPSANAGVFQPTPAKILGDMVSDFLPDEQLNPGGEDTRPAVAGGASILVAGADSAVATPDPTPSVKGLPNHRHGQLPPHSR